MIRVKRVHVSPFQTIPPPQLCQDAWSGPELLLTDKRQGCPVNLLISALALKSKYCIITHDHSTNTLFRSINQYQDSY